MRVSGISSVRKDCPWPRSGRIVGRLLKSGSCSMEPADREGMADLVFDQVPDRFEGIIIRHFRRTGREPYQEIHPGLDHDIVTRLAFRGQDGDPARFTIDRDMHEDIEADRDIVCCNAMILQCRAEIAKTTPMRLFMTVD